MPDTPAPRVPRSRRLRITAIALAALLLTSTFIYLGFPYDLLADVLTRQLERATGYQVSYGDVSASPGLLGPGIAITDLRASVPGGDPWDFSRVRLRPAWSMSWLTGRPAVFVDASSELGHVRGVTTFRGAPSFDGEAEGLDLASLLAGALPPRMQLTGTADVIADVAMAPEGAQGPITLLARDGTLAYPGLPLDIPYQQIDGEFRLGGEVTAEIVSLTISSPMGSGSVSGTVGPSPVLARAPLDLAIEISAAENIRSTLESQGVRFGRDGTMALQLRGTVSDPAPVRR